MSRNREMFAIDLFICSSDYWLMISETKKGWQFEIYFPSKKYYCNVGNFYYSTRLGCVNSAREVTAKFLKKIAEM